jgi:multiple sugar transport system permease protein
MGGFQKFIWLRNYIDIISDAEFWKSMLNTLYYVIGTVPLTMMVSLFFAIFLNQKIRALGIYRTIYYLPVVTSIVAISMIWKWIFHPRMGIANYFLNFVGVGRLDWLDEPTGIFKLMFQGIGFNIPDFLGGPSLALVAIIITGIWKGLGYNIIIFLSGLQNISQSYYEAAEIDGASGWQKFRHVTWTLLSPTTFYVFIMSTIVSFQVFGQIYMMTSPPGGPLGTTNVIVHYLFEVGFQGLFRSGYASALAFVLFIIILALTIYQRRVGESRVHYG